MEADELVNRWALHEGRTRARKLLVGPPEADRCWHVVDCEEATAELEWYPEIPAYSDVTPGEPAELSIVMQCPHQQFCNVDITAEDPPSLILQAVKWCLENSQTVRNS